MSVNSNTLGQNKLKKRSSLTDSNLLLIITIAVFFVMYTSAVIYLKQGFLKPQMFFNILNENASLLVLSCGMTLVMITGGIDISVGQVTSLVCMTCAVYLQKVNDGLIAGNVFTSMCIALAIGLAFGIVQEKKTVSLKPDKREKAFPKKEGFSFYKIRAFRWDRWASFP